MELTIPERLVVFGLLPETGSFLNLKLVRKAREALTFTEEEHARYKFINHPDGRVTWTIPEGEAVDATVDVPLSEPICAIVKKELLKLDKEEKLETRHVTVYEKFIGDTEE
jgi:hypothetical protein